MLLRIAGLSLKTKLIEDRMNQTFKHLYTIILFVAFLGTAFGQNMNNNLAEENNKNELGQGKKEALEWFSEAKFGMFIHWGLYSQLGGEWQGERYYGIAEWIMQMAKIPVIEYEKVAKEFNPIKFNAEQWVQQAKRTGARYIVITAKHHDGFAMYNSKASDYNIVKTTPYKKDPLKALAKACKKEGIKLCFYYSQDQDWHEKDASGNTWDFDPKEKNYTNFFENKVLPQVKEILTNYGEIGLIWFDTPGLSAKSKRNTLPIMCMNYSPIVW